MADSSVANAAKESAQAEFSHGLYDFRMKRRFAPAMTRKKLCHARRGSPATVRCRREADIPDRAAEV